MKNENQQNGFSVVEVLIVAVIIGVVATVSIVRYRQTSSSAENGTAVEQMRKIAAAQADFFSQNKRYGRLQEINSLENGTLGQNSGNQLTQGKFTFEMIPAAPLNNELNHFVIKATRPPINPSESVYVLRLDESGEVTQLTP